VGFGGFLSQSAITSLACWLRAKQIQVSGLHRSVTVNHKQLMFAGQTTSVDTVEMADKMTSMDQLRKILQVQIDTNAVTVADLARHLGCSRQHIYNILKGQRFPTMDFAERLAAELGLVINLSVRKKGNKIPQ